MLLRKHLLAGQVLMKFLDDVSISGRRAGRSDLNNQVRGTRFAGLGEMDFVAGPGRAFLAAIAGFHIIGRRDQHR